MTERIVIVGGGPAALATARSYREHGGRGRVTMLAGEPHPPYRRPPLTKEFLRGELDRARLSLAGVDFYEEAGIELLTGARVVEASEGEVRAADGRTFAYDRLVLATGARPARLPVPGADLGRVHVVRTIEDSERLRTLTRPGVRAVVIGSGFIGCEVACSLALKGANVTLVTDEELPQRVRLGEAAGRILDSWLRSYGVRCLYGSPVETIEEDGGGVRVQLAGAGEVSGDFAVMGAGIVPNSELAELLGLTIGSGRVVTDERMVTSDGRVLAVGDVAYARNAAAGRHLAVEHWGEALNHGRVAGATLAGRTARWDAAPGFWSSLGRHTIKYVAWGDGFDEVREERRDGGWVLRYGRDGVMVGVLTHAADDAYEEGRKLIEKGRPLP